jgi:GTP pyrophosphokinase
MENFYSESEKKEISNAYRSLLRSVKFTRNNKDNSLIRKGFNIAVDAHKTMRRKSGEPYIFHPIAVARIVAEEIGLSTPSIVCALLHDTVEDTDISLKDIEKDFDKTIANIIDGLTKIPDYYGDHVSIQAENFRKMLVTLSNDVRVILIKLADRLHNMRTLGSMRPDKQLKIANETLYLYAPLAHRLGLYAIKSELEDLALSYTDSDFYNDIALKLEKKKPVLNRFLRQFMLPLKRDLDAQGIKYEIKARPKTIYSIRNKIKNKNVPFDQIFDLLACRIIIESEPESEKSDCWRAYSIVTDHYKPNPDRLRDWISSPKSNGYESLHTTVMSGSGKWVEVQIRSRRMDNIAEKGFAAHWKYKEDKSGENHLDSWFERIRDSLENKNMAAIDFVDDFKLNLYSEEIYVFTPNGDLISLPSGSTALDFAYEIHSKLGNECLGAKINHRLQPLSYKLKSGEQVQVLRSKRQKPKEEWLRMVVTAKAKSAIKAYMKDEKKRVAEDGKEILVRKLNHIKVDFNSENVTFLEQHFGMDATELYYRIAKNKFNVGLLKKIPVENHHFQKAEKPAPKNKKHGVVLTSKGQKGKVILSEENAEIFDIQLAKCCQPIPGDKVFGFVTISDGVKIHRQNCPNAVQLMANYAYRIIKARWEDDNVREYLASIKFTGIDDMGLVNKITNTISQQLNINMKAISFESNDGIFTGKIQLFISDTTHLDELTSKLTAMEGIHRVERQEIH